MGKKKRMPKHHLTAALLCAVMALSSLSPFYTVQAGSTTESPSVESTESAVSTENASESVTERILKSAQDLFQNGYSKQGEKKEEAAEEANTSGTTITTITEWMNDPVRVYVEEKNGLLNDENLKLLPKTLTARTDRGTEEIPVKGWTYDMDSKTNTTVNAVPVLDEHYETQSGLSLFTAVLMLRPVVKKIAKAPAATSKIRTLRAKLFSGAVLQKDGTYVWTTNPMEKGASDKGHPFAYRVSYTLSGEGDLAPESVSFKVPKHTLKDRTGAWADEVEWSIPSKADVTAATDKDGNINEEEISQDVSYAYYEDGDYYTIYNFRPVRASDQGFFELSYKTSKTTFNYKDMEAMSPFTVSMHLKDGTENGADATADPITTKIDTNALITSTEKRYPVGNRIKTWQSSWGDKPANADSYYYIVWEIRSVVHATQPYNFKINDNLTSNYGGMEILGYRYSGETTFHKDNPGVESTWSSDYQRSDYVLMGIPLSVYQDKTLWIANNQETAVVTPIDKIDSATQKSASQRWIWTKPIFHEPTGIFNGYKRGDGGYRTYNGSVFYRTHHNADSLDFEAGEFSRYDLEKFSGYDQAQKELTKYDGFDYASWLIGYPGSYTYSGSDTKNQNNYYKKDVRYTLVDEGIYLANDELAVSKDSSEARSLGNGIQETMDGKKTAIKLSSDDFRIDSLQFSVWMADPEFDEETQTFTAKTGASHVTYGDNETLEFYGKFGKSNDWVKFASFNLKTNTASPVSAYVKSMEDQNIVMQDNQDLIAYKVETQNHHYYSEVYTVPNMSLKNSAAVLDLLKNSRNMVLVNNNVASMEYLNGSSWSPVVTVYHSDLDYACVTKHDSGMEKTVVTTTNNTKRRYFTITWKLSMMETITTDAKGTTKGVVQDGGTFYDLIPAGCEVDKNSIAVYDNTDPYHKKTLPASAVDARLLTNYKQTGRTMLVIHIKDEGTNYSATFDTRQSWNSIKDFGTKVYNPSAYETGNKQIYNGFPDNGGTKTMNGDAANALSKDADLMSSLAQGTGMSTTPVTTARFLYSERNFDILALTSATSGLTKKIRAEQDKAYVTSTRTPIGKTYSYELRFMNNADSQSKNIVFYDSLENYDPKEKQLGADASDWRGTLTGINTSQMTLKGIAPVVYISTKSFVDLEKEAQGAMQAGERNLKDSSIWTKVTDTTDLSKARAVAIDLSKKADGSDYVMNSGESVVAYLYMKAPDSDDGKERSFHYAYNNIYETCTLTDTDLGTTVDSLANYDFTKIMLYAAGSLSLHKTGSVHGEDIQGVSFTLRGTSDYGNKVERTIQTDRNGSITFDDVEKGTYVLQETESTDDWLLDSTEHKVQITGAGHTIVDGKDVTDSALELTDNPRIHADIAFKKVDLLDGNKVVPGASFRLSGKSDYGTDVLETAQSDARGMVSFVNIEKGTYELKETSAPEGYITNEDQATVVVDVNGNVTITSPETAANKIYRNNAGTYCYPDEPLHTINFTKQSSYDQSILAGAEFSLTGTSQYGTVVNKTAVSAETSGTVRFKDLEPGTYVLQETKAPDGFSKDTEQHAVTIKHDGTYTISGLTKDNDGVYVLYNTKNKDKKVTIVKVWDDGTDSGSVHTDADGKPDPSKLKITISTLVPEKSKRTFKVIYDANGGEFSDGAGQ